MKAIFYAGVALAALGIQITIVPSLAIWGIRPDVPLVALLAVTLRWRDRYVFAYGALLGVALDSFSHGMLGVYGISFFVAALAARMAGGAMYEDNLVSAVVAVLALSLLEGLVFVTVFHVLDRRVPWWNWMLLRVLPGSLYNAAVSPLVFVGLAKLERRLKLFARA